MRFVPLIAFLIAAPVASAQLASSPASTLESFGLVGHLADDCSSKIGKGHVRFFAQKDRTVRVDTFGPAGRPFVMIVSDAKLLDANELQVQTAPQGGKPKFTSIWEKQGDKFRLRSSQRGDGAYTVKAPEPGKDPDPDGFGGKWVSACKDAPT